METNKQVTYLCKKTYIEQGKAVFIKNKMYVGRGNHISGESAAVYMDDNTIKKYFEESKIPKLAEKESAVNHPKHYNSHPSGIECIEIARHYCFSVGNAIKYLWRAGLKQEEGLTSKQKEIQDLHKAIWYLNDRIKELSKNE